MRCGISRSIRASAASATADLGQRQSGCRLCSRCCCCCCCCAHCLGRAIAASELHNMQCVCVCEHRQQIRWPISAARRTQTHAHKPIADSLARDERALAAARSYMNIRHGNSNDSRCMRLRHYPTCCEPTQTNTRTLGRR